MREAMEFAVDLEPERCELQEDARYRFEVDRRSFLGIAGAGLLITSTVSAVAQSRRGGGSEGSVAARLHITQDGRVTVMTSKVEVGQGSRAQLTQAAAEELCVPIEQVKLIMADSAVVPDDGGTAGSRTTPSTVPAVRRGAAAARELLIDLAAKQWGVAPESLKVEAGVIKKASGEDTVSYAELARSKNLEQVFQAAIPRDVTLAKVEDWQVLGTTVERPDGRDIVTGAHRYPSDIVRPNMLYGSVLRPPSYGATLTAIDMPVAEKMPGVVAVRDGNFVGCAAKTSHLARQAVAALQKTASWNEASHPSSKELFTYLRENTTSGAGRRRPRSYEEGSIEAGKAASAHTLEASYEIAYVQHAPMEPRAAAAEWNDGSLTVWTGTQQPARVRRELAEAFRISEERLRVIVPDTGGGFGGKHTGDAAVEAARLAKAAGRPVLLRWTREEEFTWAYFRPAGLIEAAGGIDSEGRLVSWEFANYNSGSSALRTSYDVPNTCEQFLYCNSPLREGSYRALASTANNFAREAFMDELAEAAKMDPLDFRLANLTHERLRPVLEAAAERFGWRERKRRQQPNRGIGLAAGTEKGSYVAACVEVEVDRERGAIRVLEICQSFECGAIQNPGNLRAQVEGCIIMTLGGALREEIQFADGRILNPRFSQYAVPRFKDAPPIETVLLDRPDLTSAGAGETPMIAVPPAIANAVYDASSVRLRSMPMRGAALRRA